MRKQRKLSPTAARVLSLFVDAPDREIFGLEVIKEAEIPSGSLYPILHRLEGLDLLRAEWESLETAVAAGHRPRKKYRLNPDAMERAAGLIAEVQKVRSAERIALKPRPA
jgi:PadR family transcriptional regulator